MDLQVATPKIKGFFAATKEVVSGSANKTIYGVAQCAETTSETGCQGCLNVAYTNVQSCLPDTDCWIFDLFYTFKEAREGS